EEYQESIMQAKLTPRNIGFFGQILTFLIVLSVVPCLILGIITYQLTKSNLEANLQQELQRLIQEVTFLLDEFMISRGRELEIIAAHPTLQSDNKAAIENTLDSSIKKLERFSWISVVGDSGQELGSAGQLLLDAQQDPAGLIRSW
ncbi:MAG: hypothetical protein ACK8QZ_11370, partial [Anaerolineales bacterium]